MWNSISLSTWRDRFFDRSPREQFILLLGCCALISFLLFRFAYLPLHDRMENLEASVATKEKDLEELKKTIAEYKQIKKLQRNKHEKAEEIFNLFSVLEKIAAQCRLMDKLAYMKPGSLQIDSLREEKWVEVKLLGITLKEMVQYLYNLHREGRGIYIKRLAARKNGEYLDITLQPAVLVSK
ncbi:MAG: type II secretion system protein M [Deltaproteobacteria bacterium]|nr:type II secretion system protein M [Deltaproteobacteria bacterium]MBW2016431.1 type II secretion system protein M [Deltaproteobacteria bacterium]MBW2129849.1 type II secretion system protein M [Deltaproteobacteria bacterium]MBW2304105.1 type II secretion system protein M [Deltaproteobacteria bacterium]